MKQQHFATISELFDKMNRNQVRAMFLCKNWTQVLFAAAHQGIFEGRQWQFLISLLAWWHCRQLPVLIYSLQKGIFSFNIKHSTRYSFSLLDKWFITIFIWVFSQSKRNAITLVVYAVEAITSLKYSMQARTLFAQVYFVFKHLLIVGRNPILLCMQDVSLTFVTLL